MDCRAGTIPCSIGNASAARATTDFSWRLKRAIRDLPKTACANCWNKQAGNTSPSFTRTKYVAWIFCDFSSVHDRDHRGFRVSWTISTQPPLEVFPDMVRQMKVRAQAPLDFFADGRGPRLPVAGTVPIGYEMPKP